MARNDGHRFMAGTAPELRIQTAHHKKGRRKRKRGK
jgi:hypothetical protein